MARMTKAQVGSKLDRLMVLKAEIAAMEQEVEEIETDVKSYMRSKDMVQVGLYEITWRSYSRTLIDGDRLKKELPDLATKYQKIVPYKKFKVTKKPEPTGKV